MNTNRDSVEPVAVIRWNIEETDPSALYLHESETVEIGRLSSNDLCLSNPMISRQHAVVTWRGSGFQIRDLQSRNGTFVNGERVLTPVELKDGDLIELETVKLHFYSLDSLESTMDPASLEGDTIVVPEVKREPRLIVSSGEQEGRCILLHSPRMVIGRATDKEDWDIDLQGKAISRPHAEISREAGKFHITDLGSVNGTLVNGEWITEPAELENGDILELGETILIFRN